MSTTIDASTEMALESEQDRITVLEIVRTAIRCAAEHIGGHFGSPLFWEVERSESLDLRDQALAVGSLAVALSAALDPEKRVAVLPMTNEEARAALSDHIQGLRENELVEGDPDQLRLAVDQLEHAIGLLIGLGGSVSETVTA
jgi:hypothetical protein